MRKQMLFLVALSTLTLTGCAGILRNWSAGQTGCDPDDITIEDDRLGFGSRTWVARCGHKIYQCTAIGGGQNAAPNVTCRLRGGDAPAAPAPGGCQHDSQCKGERVCVDGRCVNP